MKLLVLTSILLSAAPVFAQDDSDPHTNLFRASMVAAMGAHGADLDSTASCIGVRVENDRARQSDPSIPKRGCRELNPVLLRFNNAGAFGAAKMVMAALQLWLVDKFHDLFPKAAIAVNMATTVLFTGIAIHNWRAAQ